MGCRIVCSTFPLHSKSFQAEYLTYADFFIDEYPSYLDSYVAMTPLSNTTNFQLGGRLIPRSVVEQNTGGLTSALRYINENGAVVSGVSVKADLKPETPQNSVNPVWRTAVFDAVLGTYVSHQSPESTSH